MYKPKFFVTQKQYEIASQSERDLYNYVVVEDKPIKLPENFNLPKYSERESQHTVENSIQSQSLFEK